jgi:hypothetical protein
METVFSHIVQTRFSRVSEDDATDALWFILHSSESARNGMMKLLHGVVPTLPLLRFQTQLSEDSSRPDMWGLDEGGPRVFLENKFWAGLTLNQPVSYLKLMAGYKQPTILLVVAPEAREHTLWRELRRRLEEAEISETSEGTAAGILHSVATDIGPILAITSWTRLLSALELEVADDPSARSDLLQLRSLCEAADSDAFVPIAPEEVTDQRTPAFIRRLASLLQTSVDLAESEGVLSTDGLNPSSSWVRFGRYVSPSKGFDSRGLESISSSGRHMGKPRCGWSFSRVYFFANLSYGHCSKYGQPGKGCSPPSTRANWLSPSTSRSAKTKPG